MAKNLEIDYDFVEIEPTKITKYSKNDIVKFIGTTCIRNNEETKCKPGKARVALINAEEDYPYYLIPTEDSKSTVFGWVKEEWISEKIDNKEAFKEIFPINSNALDLKMKYNENNQPLECIMTHSTCYLSTKKMNPKGILLHSTGINSPNLKRYIQPSKDDKNYMLLMEKLGSNSKGNDYNHISINYGVNAWIGKLADGEVSSVQTLPWDYRPWGCGSGEKGSCNDYWIHIEICEDDLTNQEYFNKVYEEAVHLIAYLCDKFYINPYDILTHCEVEVPTILCHQDAAKLGLATNHVDVYHWFNKYNKTINDLKRDVSKLLFLSEEIEPMKSVGYIPITTSEKVEEIEEDTEFEVEVFVRKLNVRLKPNKKAKIVQKIKKGTKCTIVETQDGWGKLKTGEGWIDLRYVK